MVRVFGWATTVLAVSRLEETSLLQPKQKPKQRVSFAAVNHSKPHATVSLLEDAANTMIEGFDSKEQHRVRSLMAGLDSTLGCDDDCTNKTLEILETLECGIQDVMDQFHSTDQGSIDSAIEIGVNCLSTKQAADEAVTNADKIRNTSKSEFVTCLEEELSEFTNQNRTCDRVDNLVDELECPCGLDEVGENKDGSCPGPASIDEAREWLLRIKNYASNKLAAYTRLTHACTNATTDHENKKKDCQREQFEFESDYCLWYEDVYAQCQQYESCEINAKMHYDNVTSQVLIREASRKEQFKHYKHLVCLIRDVVHADKTQTMTADQIEDMARQCKDAVIDDSNYTIDYREWPEAAPCEYASLEAPGHSGWHPQEYGELGRSIQPGNETLHCFRGKERTAPPTPSATPAFTQAPTMDSTPALPAACSIGMVEIGIFKGKSNKGAGDECPVGMTSISSLCECKAAADYIQETFMGERSSEALTSGCSLIRGDPNDEVWFNSHVGAEYGEGWTGGETAPVCQVAS